MKKLLLILPVAFACVSAQGAQYQIKKAAPVAVQKQSGTEALTSASLLPTALSLVTNIMALNQQTKLMEQKCAPTSAELQFVQKLMKEWARAGGALSTQPDSCDTSGRIYSDEAQAFGFGGSKTKPCVNTFQGPGNVGQIWEGFPSAAMAMVCSGGTGCAKAKDSKVITNIYEIFGLITFGPDDLLPAESSTAVRLIEKMEVCSPEAITAKKREMWGGFLTTTVSGLGKKQTNENMLGQISGIMQTSGNNSMGAVTSMLPAMAGMMMK